VSGGGIDGDGTAMRRSRAARKRTLSALRTCGACGRRSVMARHRVEPGLSVRVCRYCRAERIAEVRA